jgi:hypothetical protein
VPAAVNAPHDRVLDGGALVPVEHQPDVGAREAREIVGVEGPDPPVLAPGVAQQT